MKRIVRDKTFAKHYKTRIAPNPKLVKQFDDRIQRFFSGERSKSINDHALTRDKRGQRAFSIAGDIRVVYTKTDDSYIFQDVGSHNQVF